MNDCIWEDWIPTVGCYKPEEYRFRAKNGGQWFLGDGEICNPFMSQFNVDTYDYQIPKNKIVIGGQVH